MPPFGKVDPSAVLGPMSAIVVGNSTNEHMGVFGHSANNIGVYALSDAHVGLYASGTSAAAVLDGQLIVNGIDVIGKLNDLETGVQTLQQAIQTLQQSIDSMGTTERGMGLRPPQSRPILNVKQTKFFPSYDGNSYAHFAVSGSGFINPSATLYAYVKDKNDIHNPPDAGFLNAPDYSNNPSVVTCDIGDQVTFLATDGSVDTNDTTGKLWSVPFTLTVIKI